MSKQDLEIIDIHKHTVVKNQDGTYTLHRDGQPTRCPIIPPLIVPGKIQGGRMNINIAPCSTGCAKAFIQQIKHKESDESGYEYVQGCAIMQRFIIENLSDTPPQDKPAFDKASALRSIKD